MRPESRAHRWHLALLVLTICLLALRLWHIRADFPDYHFYSQERARFTDEGFYTSAALHYFTLRRAYVPGGWNPGVLMPVWPLLVGFVFHFTGISVVAAVRWPWCAPGWVLGWQCAWRGNIDRKLLPASLHS